MTLVTANKRLARNLRRDFDLARKSEGLLMWDSPDILPWDAWLNRLWSEALYEGRQDRILLTAPQEHVLWEQIVASSQQGRELMDPAGAAELAADAWKLIHDERLPRNLSAFEGVPDTEAFYGWMQSFEMMLARGNLVSAAQLPSLLDGMKPESEITHAGFDEPSPAQLRLFASVNASTWQQPALNGRLAPVRAGLPGKAEELQAAAKWARERLERDPAAKVGIVIPDLTAQRSAVDRIFGDVLGTRAAYHVSAPPPLAGSPLIQAALLVLKLCRGISRAECGSLLRSPYFRHTQQEGARADLELRRSGALTVKLNLKLFPKLAPAFGELPTLQRPAAWSHSFSHLVATSGWPGTRTLSSAEYQAIVSWKDLLADFARLDLVLREAPFSEALTRLIELANKTPFAAAEQNEPVQIMGVLEAAGSQFDACWIAGLEDRTWPPGPRQNPFLPLAPGNSVEEQYQYAARITTRLLASAGEVVCSYPTREGEELLRPSPLIAALPERRLAAISATHLPVRLDELLDDQGPPLTPNGVQRGGMSVIADQSACPFRAFARYRLHLRSLEEAEPGLSLQERGTVTHKALEIIWLELKSQKALMPLEYPQLHELVAKAVRQALTSHLRQESRKLTVIQALEAKRLCTLLVRWMYIEKSRPDFEIASQETTRRFIVGGLELDIKTDRADRYTSDGTLAIIDYKTGTTSKTHHWEGDRPKAPQVPLYSVAAGSPVSSVMFAQLATGSTKLVGYSDLNEPQLKQHKVHTVPELVENWRAILEVIGAEFVQGEARVDPAAGALTCRQCDLQPLCRIGPAGEIEEDAARE